MPVTALGLPFHGVRDFPLSLSGTLVRGVGTVEFDERKVFKGES